jgi:dTDP-4-amino-4,6-dideoxygalactose transaminase
MNDFKSEPPALRAAMGAAFRRVLDSGLFILGQEVENFEKQWAQACSRRFGIGVGNGLDAIEFALRGMGIGPGDEVITTPVTAFATVLAIYRAGAEPVFADIDPETALLSPQSARRCLSPRTKAVLLVHLYGRIHAMDGWVRFCEENGIALVEDCAQSHGAQWQSRPAGSFGRAAAYSFYPTKNLGAMGDAGMTLTDDPSLAEKIRCLRHYGQDRTYSHPILGANSRLDELQAALLSERLKWLPEFTRRRQSIAAAYFTDIGNPVVRLLARPIEESNHVYHLFVVNVSDREDLTQYLRGRGIAALCHYPIPADMQAPCRHARCDPEGLPNAERHAQSCLSIPCHPQMTDADVREVIRAINEYR